MAKKTTKQDNRHNDALELEQSYRKVSGKSKGTGWKVTIVVLLVVVLTLSICFLAGCFSDGLEDGIIMDNVKVAGVDVGGMTKEEAVSTLRLSITDNYEKNPLVVVLGEQHIELTAEVSKITLDAEGAVEAAYGAGRTGTRAEKQEQQLLASTTGVKVDVAPFLTYDADAVVAHLDSLNLTPEGSVIQSTWELVGEAPDLSAEALPEETQSLVIHMGTPAYHYDLDSLLNEIADAYQNNALMVEFDCEAKEPDPVDLDVLYEQYHKEPVDASMDAETYEVVPHSHGYSFDLESAKTALAEAQFGTDLEIPFVATASAQTTEALSGLLFRDVLASHSAYSASGSNRATNLRLACEALDGIILMPGEVFSYNDALGERTAAKGYKAAASYVGGKTVDTLGGGICQPSSVLYYCALLSDLEIVERYCHQFISSYMDPGMDATVSWGGPHFRFRNSTEYPIRIDAKADGGKVSIQLVGTDTKDHYVKMEYVIIDSWGWTVDYEEYTPEQAKAKGYSDGKVLSTPYTGYIVDTYRCRYSKEDDSLIEKVFEVRSEYDSRDKLVVKVIEEEKEESKPSEPESKPTTTPTTMPTTTPTTTPTTAPTTAPTTQPTDPSTSPPADPPADSPADPPASSSEGEG